MKSDGSSDSDVLLKSGNHQFEFFAEGLCGRIIWENIGWLCFLEKFVKLDFGLLCIFPIDIDQLFSLEETAADSLNEFQEELIFGHKVSFAINFKHYGLAPARSHEGGHDALSCLFVCSFVCWGKSLLSEPKHGLFMIALWLLQRFLAFSHGGACFFSQFFESFERYF